MPAPPPLLPHQAKPVAAKGKAKAAVKGGFSDHNAKWLKPSPSSSKGAPRIQQRSFVEDEEDEDEDEEGEEEDDDDMLGSEDMSSDEEAAAGARAGTSLACLCPPCAVTP